MRPSDSRPPRGAHSPHPLPTHPRGAAFEDLLCALFVASGWNVSPNVRHLEGGNALLEVDLLASRWEGGEFRRILVEAKSGGWGWGDVLKLLGQGALLEVPEQWFFATQGDRDSETARERFESAGCHIVVTEDTSEQIRQAFNAALPADVTKREMAFWWHSFTVRREILRCANQSGLPASARSAVSELKEQQRLIDDGLFQETTYLARMRVLRHGYENRRNLASRTADVLDASPDLLSGTHFRDALYGVPHPLVEAALYVEMRSRLAMLVAVIEFLLMEDDPDDASQEVALLLGLPSSTTSTIRSLRDRTDLHLYPLVWQRFVYEFGGFAINDRSEEEYTALAEQIGATPATVTDALEVWETLYPGVDWFAGYYGIRLLKLVPAPIQGLGTLRRTQLYKTRHGDRTYPYEMTDHPTGMAFLKRVNNIAYFRAKGEACPESHLGPAERSPEAASATET
jgi:hypothetical protein